MFNLMNISQTRKTVICAALIAAAGFIVYANSLNGQFLWDDTLLISENNYVRSWSNAPKMFMKSTLAGVDREGTFYRPLQMLSNMSDYGLWLTNVRGYHLTNIMVHTGVALAIFWLVTILFGDRLTAFLSGVLFAVHPIHTEAVAYISGRADPLAAFFILLCLILYIKNGNSRKPVLYILTGLSALLALLSKEISLILPFLIALYTVTFKAKFDRRAFNLVIAAAILYLLIRVEALKSVTDLAPCVMTPLERLPGFFVALYNYVKLLIFPLGLHMEYGNKVFGFLDPRAMAGALILLFLIICVAVKRKNTVISFSLMWFFINLAPVSNIYPLNTYMAEHWLYLPSIGIFIICASGLSGLYRIKKLKTLAIVSSALLVGAYSLTTIKQNATWRDPVIFYTRLLNYAPDSARVHNNLGNEYYRVRNYPQAIESYKKSLSINSVQYLCYRNLGDIYVETGRRKEALDCYTRSLMINPGYEVAYNNVGTLCLSEGNYEGAVSVLKKAVEVNPGYGDGQYNLAVAYYYNRQYDLAVKHCDLAMRSGYKVNPKLLELLKPYR